MCRKLGTLVECAESNCTCRKTTSREDGIHRMRPRWTHSGTSLAQLASSPTYSHGTISTTLTIRIPYPDVALDGHTRVSRHSSIELEEARRESNLEGQ